jgi:hypothetical protein
MHGCLNWRMCCDLIKILPGINKDNTGAGTAKGKKIDKAVRFASVVSAITVTVLGAKPSVPCRDEIDGFLGFDQ